MGGTIWDFIRQIIASRGAQLISRYVATGLFSLATYLGVSFDADTTTKTTYVIVTCLIAAALKIFDLVSHKMQQADKDMAIEEERRLAANLLVKAQAGSSTFLKLVLIGTLILAAGCKTTEQIAAAVGAAATTAIAHTEVHVTFDPVSGVANATVTFKDAQGRECTRVMSAEEMTHECKRLNDAAQSNLKATYQRAVKEMRATEKREMDKLKAARKQCGKIPTVELPAPAVPVVNVPSGPQFGDEVVPTTTADDGSFSIPAEKGLWRVVRVPASEKCYIDANGRKICK